MNNDTDMGEESFTTESPLDDLEHLYIGQIEGATGLVVFEEESYEINLRGEVLVYGRAGDDGGFMVERIRRVALYGQVAEAGPEVMQQIGVLSLVGPIGDAFVRERDAAFFLKLHYAALTYDLPPAYEGEDCVIPQQELMGARLRWHVESWEERSVGMVIDLMVDELIEPQLGLVRSIALEMTWVAFQLAGAEPVVEPPMSLLAAAPPSFNCPPPPAGPGLESTVRREMAIRFINFSSYGPGDLIAGTAKTVAQLCADQMAMACGVWRTKSALHLSRELTIQEGSAQSKADYATCLATDEGSIVLAEPALNSGGVDIYLINTLLNRPGGGVTHDVNVASAFCIVGVDQIGNKPYLLAHELCHVVGLEHADGAEEGVLRGSVNSVANPDPVTKVISGCQTKDNLRIFASNPTNPMVKTTEVKDWFRYDLICP